MQSGAVDLSESNEQRERSRTTTGKFKHKDSSSGRLHLSSSTASTASTAIVSHGKSTRSAQIAKESRPSDRPETRSAYHPVETESNHWIFQRNGSRNEFATDDGTTFPSCVIVLSAKTIGFQSWLSIRHRMGRRILERMPGQLQSFGHGRWMRHLSKLRRLRTAARRRRLHRRRLPNSLGNATTRCYWYTRTSTRGTYSSSIYLIHFLNNTISCLLIKSNSLLIHITQLGKLSVTSQQRPSRKLDMAKL